MPVWLYWVKGKVVPVIKHYALKTYEGVDIQIHIVLTSALVEVNGQLHAPATLLLGKEPWYSLDRRFGGPPNRYGQHEKE
jgi:hypothetical protein